MYVNGHYIIEFIMLRCRLTKKEIADNYLLCSQGTLSRDNPPDIEPREWYERLFDVEYPGSAARIASERADDFLYALIDFLGKKGCINDVDFIMNRINSEAKYKDIIIELLKRANIQPESQPERRDVLGAHKISETDTLIIEEKKSLLEKFDSAISKYKFVEFIRSEPLREFVESPEIDAVELESQYANYEDGLRDSTRDPIASLSGDRADISQLLFSDYQDYGIDNSQDENFPYTHGFLTPTLLDMSQRLVNTLVAKLFHVIEPSSHAVYDNILKFRDALNTYNEFLKEHLRDEGDYFIYNFESVINKEELLKLKGTKEVMALCVALIKENENIDGKSITLEYTKNTELDDESKLMGFYAKARQDRGAIYLLYEKARKKIIQSGS